jgi:transcriptional regulator with XRE-family HTH domain
MIAPSRRRPARLPGLAAANGHAAAGLGSRIRALRLQRRRTLQDLAGSADITPSALSQIERDQASPTLGTIKALATALGTTIGQLFPPATVPGRVVVRPGDRKRMSPRRGITYELLTPDLSGQIEFILSVYEPGASTGDTGFAYPAEQCGLVIEGTAEVHLNETVHRLRAGDSIRFDCSIPHRIVNVGRDKLRCLWAITPPTF